MWTNINKGQLAFLLLLRQFICAKDVLGKEKKFESQLFNVLRGRVRGLWGSF